MCCFGTKKSSFLVVEPTFSYDIQLFIETTIFIVLSWYLNMVGSVVSLQQHYGGLLGDIVVLN